MKRIAVIYHKNCLDGFTAAWAAWKRFGSRAEYFPVDPEVLPKEQLKNRNVFILDTSYPGGVLRKLTRENRTITVIDHHVSVKSYLKYATQFVFDNKHSGCVLAWRFFHRHERLPVLCRYVEDVDLWRFAVKNSRAVTTALEMREFSFRAWSRIARDLESARTARLYIEKGKMFIEYQEDIVSRLGEQADVVFFEGMRTLAVNSPLFSSEIGAELVRRMPPIGLTWRGENGRLCVSLRSNGAVDVAKIAARFGGGGHRAASGFCLPLGAKLPWKYLKPSRTLWDRRQKKKK